MADICCGVVSGAEAACEAREGSPPSTRKRKMEVRRFKFVGGVEKMAIPGDFSRKRQNLEFPSPPRSVLTDVDGGKDTLIGKEGESSSDPSSSLKQEASTAASLAESSGSGRCLRYGVKSICGRRRDMEDAIAIRPDFAERSDRVNGKFHFFGVYDGHGCSHVCFLAT